MNPQDPKFDANAPSQTTGIDASSAAAAAGQMAGQSATGGGPSPNAIADGKKIAMDALVGVQALCDKILGEVSGEVPKLTQDGLDFANSFITKSLPGPIGGLISAALAAGEMALKQPIDAKAAAFIAVLKTDVDSAIGHLEQQFK